jgi:DNA-binding MarR family transcriptional regulator
MEAIELSSALRSAISILHKRLRKQMYSAQTHSITELETMGFLYRQGSLLPSELAAQTKVKTQSMSQVLNKMEAQKIIERTPSQEDKRKTYISLTDLGKKIVEQTRYERDEWLAKAIAETCNKQERELLIKALTPLKKLVDFEG